MRLLLRCIFQDKGGMQMEKSTSPRAKKTASPVLEMIGKLQDVATYRELNWEGTFDEYLAIVKENPKVARSALSAFMT